jgi:hypothetical protein
MALSMSIPDAVIEDIARQVGRRLPPDLVPMAGVLSIAETFELWNVSNAGAHDLPRAITTSGAFHHQIWAAERPIAFARSRRRSGDPEMLDVTQVFVSPLARDLADAIEFADQNEPLKSNTSVARLVRASGLQLTALLFGNDSTSPVLVVAAPAANTLLRRGTLIEGKTFMDQLRLERPIEGRKQA